MKRCTVERHGDVLSLSFGYNPIGRPTPIMTVYCYLIDGVLIDTAQKNMRRHVLSAISENRIDRILLTHHHEDHSGNAAKISEARNVAVYGHPLTRNKMSRGFRILPYQRVIWGRSSVVDVNPLPERIETDRFVLRPVHTPGHSKDHTVYLEEENGWLFSGDLYLGEKIKFFRSDERFKEQIDSLKRILCYDFDALFCAHRPSLRKGKEKLEKKLAFLEDFYGRVGTFLGKGFSEEAIVRRMDTKQDRKIRWMTMGNACMENMIRSAVRAASGADR